jgi:hypothetical protein
VRISPGNRLVVRLGSGGYTEWLVGHRSEERTVWVRTGWAERTEWQVDRSGGDTVVAGRTG